MDQLQLRQRLSRVPPLSIRYLLFATGVTAVALSLLRLLIRQPIGLDDLIDKAATILLVLVFAWTTSGALLIAWHAARRTLWSLEPGERGVIAAAVLASLYLAKAFIFRYLSNPWVTEHPFVFDRSSIRWFAWVAFATSVVMVMVYAFTAWHERQRKGWMVCYGFLFATCVGESAAELGLWFSPVDAWFMVSWKHLAPTLALAPLLLVTIAIAIDQWRHEKRHWLHWTGAIATAVCQLPFLVPFEVG